MKKILLNLALLVSFSMLSHAGELDQMVDPFTSVSITGNFKITMIAGDEERVKISNNDENITDDKILISVSGGTLEIKIKGDTYKERNMEVTIFYKKVFEIDAKRGARVTVSSLLKGDVITFNCSTGGQVKAEIEAGTAKLKISNDGLINVTGTATIAEMEVSTGGQLSASQLITETASAKVTAGGNISLNATKKLTANVMSGGTITYRGNPATVEESVKLGGSITKHKE